MAEALVVGPQSVVLDIGSGLGGAARALAVLTGCRVVSVDLTPAFCDAAGELSCWTGLVARTSFQLADTTDVRRVEPAARHAYAERGRLTGPRPPHPAAAPTGPATAL